jgi:hypothetical protein
LLQRTRFAVLWKAICSGVLNNFPVIQMFNCVQRLNIPLDVHTVNK